MNKQNIFCLLLIAATLAAPPVYANNIISERDALLIALKTLTTSDLSCDKNEDCAVVGIGEKPCGGPLSYLPYSTRNTKASEIQQKADALRQLDLKDNSESHRMGTCDAVLPPGLACVNHVCVIDEKIHF